MAVLLCPVVLVTKVFQPKAQLPEPLVLLKSAVKPVAVLYWPVLNASASDPTAVLPLAVLLNSVQQDPQQCCHRP